MEIGRPPPGPAGGAAPPPRPETTAPPGAVPTTLPPATAVRGVEPAVRVDTRPDAPGRAALDAALRDTIARNIEVDPKTREVVFQTLDPRTGEIVRQVPDSSLLKLRAYIREMREREPGGAGVERVA